MPHFGPPKRVAAVGLAVGAAAAVGASALLLTRDADPSPAPGAKVALQAAPAGVVQAEDLTIRPAVGQPFEDAEAGGGRGMMLFANGAVTSTVKGPIDRPVIRVRGDQCDGPPQMRVRVNGKKVVAMPIADEQWRTVELDVPRSDAPENVISIAFFDDSGRPGCDRNLLVDWIAADAGAAKLALADEAPAAADGTADPDPEHRADAGDPDPLHRDDGTDEKADDDDQGAPGADGSDGAVAGTTATSGPGDSGLFVDPTSEAAKYGAKLSKQRSGNAALVNRIAAQPQAVWLGEWSGDVAGAAGAVLSRAAEQGTRPVFVAYSIPGRDCGSYSAGGLPAKDYSRWIADLAGAIGSRPAIVVLEPDALPQADCVNAAARKERYALLRRAVAKLGGLANTRVYLDAGHSNWKPADEMAKRLRAAGIAGADGFALNTSNYGRTAEEVRYGRLLASEVGGKPFVVDTSRNGNGPAGSEWCNPSGRALGELPTMRTGQKGVDAFLWIKHPGESDGTCNGGPDAGVFWPKAALELARNAK